MEKKKYKLGFIEVPIDKLVKADWNYKTEDDKKQEKLKENIKRNGQIENILIRELDTGYYEVVNGNHRLSVLKELKFEKVYTYNLGKINQSQAIRIAIETNETKFETDTIELAERIKEISSVFDDLDLTLPYTEQELENFRTLSDFNWEDFEGDGKGEDFDKKITITVSQDILDRWNELKNKFNGVLGYDNESKVFEFAIIEALNIPTESIK
tara:strand:- start:1717 stop:2352 length:636 start_codon:yes stop_codon:yes gene_type:complete